MEESYIKCLKKLRKFRKSLNKKEDQKRGKLYFDWIKDKTEKVENEQDEEYIYRNILQLALTYRYLARPQHCHHAPSIR